MKKGNVFLISIVIIILFAISTGCTDVKNEQTTATTEVSTTTSSETEKNTVQMKNTKFQPDVINIQKGETVTWINNDFATHNVIGTSFESVNFGNGKTFVHKFDEVGTFDYICSLHANMKGKVIVK